MIRALLLLLAFVLQGCAMTTNEPSAGWQPLFDGRSLKGWRASDAPGTFSVRDGVIVVHGPRSHLFYVGPVGGHDFRDFELALEVKTLPNANSGVYFHTKWQEKGWPDVGYEVQVNNSHTDWRRTGGLYAIVDVKEPPAKDDTWFTQHITVTGKHVVIKVDGKVTAEYTEPATVERPADMAGRKLGSGTFALQGHDPKSKVFFKNIMVKALP